MKLEESHKIANQELEGKTEQLAKCEDTVKDLTELLDQRTNESLKLNEEAESQKEDVETNVKSGHTMLRFCRLILYR